MASSLDSMYTEIIFEHDKRPQHAGLREDFDSEVHHVNPSCGDELTMRLLIEGEGDDALVKDISYEAVGCAMSRASASIMADLFIGKTVAHAKKVMENFEGAMKSRGADAGDEELIEDGVALLGASKFPGRVKCVLLPWKAYQALIVEAQAKHEKDAPEAGEQA
ncbi:SUF system NifU family Fe-S cluster assembly protein [Dermabacteraceae bacterium TAE3-ERU27]|nr:SUF system NifU family Fe-S cluster assembly protein [Dermabacteraceae bacterium TAE3-ERU27]